jgi:selenoprotein W-related protein
MKHWLPSIALFIVGDVFDSVLLTDAWGTGGLLFAARHPTALSVTTKRQVTIEYCPGCRWNLRAFWMAQELLWTFSDAEALEAVTIIPCREEAGRFRVQCYEDSKADTAAPKLLWDRGEQSGFPDIKVLKQLVRDEIDPQRFLGHSDSEDRRLIVDAPNFEEEEHMALGALESGDLNVAVTIHSAVTPHIAITYCTQCHWLLRAAYFAQELLSTFADEMGSLSLIPSLAPNAGGRFLVHLNTDIVLWDRAAQGRFPETKELKQLVRDQLNPSKDLGHSDVTRVKEEEEDTSLDDDAAEESRAFFGVA